jgi:hypothetical protein
MRYGRYYTLQRFTGQEASDYASDHADDEMEALADAERRAEHERQAIEFQKAIAKASMRLAPPSPAVQHLNVLAFAAAALRAAVRFAAGQSWFANEEQQYVALYNARRAQLGRALRHHECDALRIASRSIWNARLMLHRAALVS